MFNNLSCMNPIDSFTYKVCGDEHSPVPRDGNG